MNTGMGKVNFWLHGVSYGENLVIAGHVFVSNTGKIEIGDCVRINSAEWANPIGGSAKTQLQVRGGASSNRK